jgi:hypothetical protein
MQIHDLTYERSYRADLVKQIAELRGNELRRQPGWGSEIDGFLADLQRKFGAVDRYIAARTSS